MKTLNDREIIQEASELKERLFFISREIRGYLDFVYDANNIARDKSKENAYNYAVQRLEQLTGKVEAARLQVDYIETMLRIKDNNFA